MRKTGDPFLHLRLGWSEYMRQFTRAYQSRPGAEPCAEVSHDLDAMLGDAAFADAPETLRGMQNVYLNRHDAHCGHARTVLSRLGAGP